ncbi:hypothetical protein F53441_6918 [Fusarium austroafricanum]|uniref:Uncharacterized protein n=1 Tax=Fusarium austroafricanum TaxID=2364996 RepID=A0A8H4KHN9_9HYPO|nr:hypothetical protein F53441_6918 [Fusarium austroafricanum]
MSESKATRNRQAQAILIENTGFLIMPCGYCEPRGLKCWAKEGYSKCAQSDRFAAEKRRLEREEEVAENELLQLQQQVNEHLSRLMRLHCQKKQLQERSDEMLRRNVETMDDLEVLDNAELFAAVEAQLLGAADVIDWGEVFAFGPLSSDVAGRSSSEVVRRS